ncbi:MAG: hypothetical protein ACE5FN_12760, partial [Leptospirillia bacterium]
RSDLYPGGGGAGCAVRQSCLMSLAESVTNVAVGYGIAVLTQVLVFPLFGMTPSLGDNLAIGAVFTVVSLARSFCLRRAFEAFR